MTKPAFPPPHSPKRSLRSPFRLVYLLLRTALWTAMLAACGVYIAYDSLIPAPIAPPEDAGWEESPPLAQPEKRELTDRSGRRQKETGTMDLVQAIPSEQPRMAASRLSGSLPAFKSAGGFTLKKPKYAFTAELRGPKSDLESGYAPAGDAKEAALLNKKFLPKGLAPVSTKAGKRYSPDKEADSVRERARRKTEAAALARKQILLEKVKLVILVALVAISIMILGSRVIKALDILEKSEDRHWTLK